MEERLNDYFQGKLTYRERLELLKEVENNEAIKTEYIKFQNITGLINLTPLENDKGEGEVSYRQFIDKQNRVRIVRVIKSSIKYAASVLLIVFSSVLLTINFTKDPIPIISENTLFVPSGQRAMIKLQDGTEVWLNAQTTMIYPSQFYGKERQVFISGEAYFMVAKNEDMPFVVTANDVDIKVLGTTFNINCYPDAGFVQTSLIEGSVEVYKQGDKRPTVVLEPNQQVTIRENEVDINTIDFPNHFLWREGIYCFNNEPLPDILKKLEMYFNVEIFVENTAISNVYYTGKFRQTDGIDDILKILSKIQRFSIEKNAEGNEITIK